MTLFPLVLINAAALVAAVYYPSPMQSVACYAAGYFLGLAVARHQIIKAQNRRRRISD